MYLWSREGLRIGRREQCPFNRFSAFDMFIPTENSYATKIDFYGDANNTIMNFKVGREDSSQSGSLRVIFWSLGL